MKLKRMDFRKKPKIVPQPIQQESPVLSTQDDFTPKSDRVLTGMEAFLLGDIIADRYWKNARRSGGIS